MQSRVMKKGERRVVRIDSQWSSPQVREYVEHLQREICRAYFVPDYYLRDAESTRRAKREAWLRTERMRLEVEFLVMTHCWPLIIIEKCPL